MNCLYNRVSVLRSIRNAVVLSLFCLLECLALFTRRYKFVKFENIWKHSENHGAKCVTDICKILLFWDVCDGFDERTY